MTERESLCEARHLTPEDERKIAAYDAARATVKIEGNTRAYYVLRAEAAEAELTQAHANIDQLLVAELRSALEEIVRRDARSDYSSIYAAPGEFAAVAREALKCRTTK